VDAFIILIAGLVVGAAGLGALIPRIGMVAAFLVMVPGFGKFSGDDLQDAVFMAFGANGVILIAGAG